MKTWKVITDVMDFGNVVGLCVGRYKDGKPLMRHAIKFDVLSSKKEVVERLRALADYVEEKFED